MILFATSNLHKFKEAKEIFKRYDLKIKQVGIKYPELQSDKLEDVAKYGVEYSVQLTSAPTIVEDSGLFIEALRGFPGPYSAFVYRTTGKEGVLRLMENLKNRKAEFQSVIGYCEPNKKPIIFKGKVKGKISYEIRGKFGFAFDSIFIPNGMTKTFGEISLGEKNKFSHRGKAFRKLCQWLKQKLR
ncbi:MAG: XTP/dITP diphosphatase [Euryarchaeota archaeon]|nr:XTP/dITP diphosphatase [Euryarchaeota archaeon]